MWGMGTAVRGPASRGTPGARPGRSAAPVRPHSLWTRPEWITVSHGETTWLRPAPRRPTAAPPGPSHEAAYSTAVAEMDDRAPAPHDTASLPVHPVVLGGDIGAYSLARAFHDAYGVRSTVVSEIHSALVRHSRVLTHVAAPGLRDDDTLVAALHRVADAAPAARDEGRLLLLASADRLVRQVAENRDRLGDRFVVPYVETGLLSRLTDKAEFATLCAELAVPHPATVVVDLADPATTAAALAEVGERFPFPVVAKAASTVQYDTASFAGKRKVFVVPTPDDLRDLMARIRSSGWRGRFVVQERIGGGDAGMRILTSYVARDGRVVHASYGHVLLEEHAPSALGNPAAILTDHDDAVAGHARRLLEHVGWRGWANFDLKVDPRTGAPVFFELNPRLGRSNHYLVAGGLNPVTCYVREHLEGLAALPAGAPDHGRPGGLFTVLPRLLLQGYLDDPALSRAVADAYRARRVHDPLRNPAERDPRRLAYVAAARANQFRKFRRYYPVEVARREAAAVAVGAA